LLNSRSLMSNLLHLAMIGSWCAADAVGLQPLPGHVLQQEYELVKNAFYTEPHDQSSWLYLRWLIGNSLAGWEKAKGTPQEASATQVACCIACLLWCGFTCGKLLWACLACSYQCTAACRT